MLHLVSNQPPDEDAIEAALYENDGNVTKAAKSLHMLALNLRKIVLASPRLREAQAEITEQSVDLAVGVLLEGLRDQLSFQNRFYAAKELLRTETARRRGFGREPGATAVLELGKTSDGKPVGFVLKWIDPPKELEPPTIEGETS